MSIHKSIDVQCDRCGQWIVEGAATIAHAKVYAKEAGSVTLNGQDVCYRCLPEEAQLRTIERELGLRV